MERIEPGEYGLEIREVIQETKIIVLATDTQGNREIEMVIASHRRPVPTPYTEEP